MLTRNFTSYLTQTGFRKKSTKNCRNGSYDKTLKTSSGLITVNIPRDRHSEYSPKIIPKFESSASELEAQIISLYAKGMTTRDISEHLKEAYMGVDISPTLISNITNKILEEVTEWQARGLDSIYPIVFFDAIHYKVRKDGKILSKAAYVCLGLNKHGFKDILGVYIGESESSSFWLSVLTDLQNRGVQDILIACIDGLKGFPDAIKSKELERPVLSNVSNSNSP